MFLLVLKRVIVEAGDKAGTLNKFLDALEKIGMAHSLWRQIEDK